MTPFNLIKKTQGSVTYEHCEVQRLYGKIYIGDNEADISTWLPREYEENLTYGQQNCEWSDWVKVLKAEIKKDSIEKIEAEAGNPADVK